MLPKDPIILLSTVNTHLRDFHESFDDFCLTYNYNGDEIKKTLATVNYYYDPETNQFI